MALRRLRNDYVCSCGQRAERAHVRWGFDDRTGEPEATVTVVHGGEDTDRKTCDFFLYYSTASDWIDEMESRSACGEINSDARAGRSA